MKNEMQHCNWYDTQHDTQQNTWYIIWYITPDIWYATLKKILKVKCEMTCKVYDRTCDLLVTVFDSGLNLWHH